MERTRRNPAALDGAIHDEIVHLNTQELINTPR